ncbi:MAG: magnesium/cobalt transporter CorA [Dehalococcoidia bacterium]
MIRSSVRSNGNLRTGLSIEEAQAALADPANLLWVDIEESGRGEGERWLSDVFDFHALTIDDCYNTLIDPPKVDDHHDYLFVIIHTVEYDPATRDLTTSELDMYIGRNFVVSFHKRPLHAVTELERRAHGGSTDLQHGADFLAHSLFDITVDDFHPIVERLDDEISTIEEQMIDRPDKQLLAQALVLRRNAQRLRRTVLPQRDVAARFARGEYPDIIGAQSLFYYRDIYDHTVRVEEMIEALRDLADSTLSTYLGALNNRTNEVMKTLAIVTAVFLPLTLIAGIYGTNFDNVPEYEWRYAYASMWTVMVVVAAGLIAWFRWRRWI